MHSKDPALGEQWPPGATWGYTSWILSDFLWGGEGVHAHVCGRGSLVMLEDTSGSVLGKEEGLCVCWAARVSVCTCCFV